MSKIKVNNKTLKKEGEKNGKKWTIWEYSVEIDGEGFSKLDSFDNLEVGKDYEGEIKKNENPAYNDNFSLKKEKKSFGNPELQKKMCALNNACLLIAHGKITSDQMIETRDKFYQYLS